MARYGKIDLMLGCSGRSSDQALPFQQRKLDAGNDCRKDPSREKGHRGIWGGNIRCRPGRDGDGIETVVRRKHYRHTAVRQQAVAQLEGNCCAGAADTGGDGFVGVQGRPAAVYQGFRNRKRERREIVDQWVHFAVTIRGKTNPAGDMTCYCWLRLAVSNSSFPLPPLQMVMIFCRIRRRRVHVPSSILPCSVSAST
jgi:hypothetical protein